MNMRTAFRKRFTATVVGAVLAAAPLASFAEDVDIFTAGSSTPAKPNVLIILDSSSNWNATLAPNDCGIGVGVYDQNTKFAAEVCALSTVLDKLPLDTIRLGLMMFSESGTNGSYVRFAIRDQPGDVTAQSSPDGRNKKALKDLLANLKPLGSGTDNSGSNQPYAKAMFEAWKYFGGGSGAAGQVQSPTGYGPEAFAGGAANATGTKRRDYLGNTSGSETAATSNRAAQKYGADDFTAFPNSTSNVYTSPILDNCAKNFVIFISNGNPGTGGDSGTPDSVTLLNNIGGNAADRVKSAGVEVHASLMDEFARYMYNNDVSPRPSVQKINTYTIAVYAPQSVNPDGTEVISNTDQQMIKLMKSAANVGGGKYFPATNPKALVDAILKILNEVQAVNSVFVSASLPVSVNTQGTFLNQVYMGLFRPDGSGNPRWLGNVKEYKFIQDSSTGDIYLADSTGQRAVNPATGFITPAAISFWTSASNFWQNNPQGVPPTGSDSPDGDVVEKGGTAEVQRKAILTNQSTRRLFTCALPTCSPGPLGTPLDNSTIVGAPYQTAFGAASAAELALLVNWIRGEDNASGAVTSPLNIGVAPCDPTLAGCTWSSGEQGPGWNTTVRASLQGDVLHSRPVVLNYEGIGPYIFYGSNDGFLRAVKGGQATTDGVEAWAFVPPEFFGKFRRLRFGDPELRTPGTPTALIPLTLPKDYFFDGPIGSWEDPSTTPPTKWIFVTARRGGRLIYAFDVTDPVNPKLMWKKTSADADFDKLGQTWSLPVAFKITGVADPFLVFGGGYDIGEDSDPVVNNTVGRGIFVLNARTGERLRYITTSVNAGTIANPIAADMAFLAKPTASGGFGDVYRGYVGDLDGNVWRLDIPNGEVGDWKLFRFATLGPGYKFMYAPDLVKAGNRDIILIGSGDREKPLRTDTQDRFFGLADFQNLTTAASAMVPLTISDLTLLSGSGGLDTSCLDCKGWYRDLALGEKVVNSPLTVAGVTYFATNTPTPPAPGTCDTNLGLAQAYGLSFLTGGKPAARSSISTTLTGGGLAPSPVGGVVDMGDGKLVTFVIGSGKDGSRLEPERPPLNVPTTRAKIYWNTKTDN